MNPQNKTKTARLVLCIELLKTFSEVELNRFFDFLDSTYHNTNKKLCLLFKLLRRYVLNTEIFSEDIQLKIYQDVFVKAKKQKALNLDQKKDLNKLMNNLLTMAEEFITVEQLKRHGDIKYELLFPELINRKQTFLYNRRLKAAEKELDKEEKKGVYYHTKQYKIQVYKSQAFFIDNKLHKEDNYDDLQYYADVKYLLEKLQYHLAKITMLNVHPGKNLDLSSYEACEALFKLPQYKKNPLIQLYLLNIELVLKDDNKTYHLLSGALQKYQTIIPASFLKPFYTNVNNYCARQLSKGNLYFYNNLWQNYKVMHQNNLLVINNSLDIAILKNIITVACRLKEYSWAIKILDENINYVNKNIRESVYNYNKGVIEFAQKNYDEAQYYFVKVRKIDEFHSIDLKVTLLKCFYEIDQHYETSTQQMIDSLRLFFSTTKKLNKKRKTSYKNFVTIFYKLYKFKQIRSKRERRASIEKELPALIDTITNKKLIEQKKWLLEKIEDLKNI